MYEYINTSEYRITCKHMAFYSFLTHAINIDYRKCCSIKNDYSLLKDTQENMLLHSVSIK